MFQIFKYKRFLGLMMLVISVAGCTNSGDSSIQNMDETEEQENQKTATFLALGDSYTIGEAVEEELRWPVQLADSARENGFNIQEPRIIATTGWTTSELLEGIESANIEGEKYDFVSLLIGVNNQFRGQDIEIYRKEFEELLDMAISFADSNARRVFVLSIPDYGVTPFGKRNAEKIAEELDQYNNIASRFCTEKNVTYFYITDISREAADNPDLIASDNLHPSGKMYTRWVELIYPWFEAKLNGL